MEREGGWIASTAGLAPLLLAGDWRYDSREFDAEAGWGSHGRGAGGTNRFCSRSPDSQLYAAGDEAARDAGERRAHIFQELAGKTDSELPAHLNAGVAEEVSRRCRRAEAGSDIGCVVNGPGESKHARILASAFRERFEEPKATGVCRWKTLYNAAWRHDCGGVQDDSG